MARSDGVDSKLTPFPIAHKRFKMGKQFKNSRSNNKPMDAMKFFEQSAGQWRSQRTIHHLAFKRSEVGDSEIKVVALTQDDPEIVKLCKLHEIDPSEAVGGCRVTWAASMSWDRDEENHDGQTVFALVPDRDRPAQGRLLRDLGYAEIVPVVGHYHMDAAGGLVLETDYETMSSSERFWFCGPNMRLRSSTVKRFGGFSTASFCTEMRVNPEAENTGAETEDLAAMSKTHASPFGW